MKAIDVQFAHRHFTLRIGYNIVGLSEDDIKAKSRMYKDPWGLHQRNYISWREAVCHFPHFISGPSKRTDRSENEETLALDLPSSNFRIAGGHPYKWAINLPAIRAEIDDDGYDGRDEQKFLWYFDSFLNALLEEEAGGDELASYNYIQSRN